MTACPRCHSTEIIRAGRETLAKAKPVQRLHCKGCGYTWRQKISQGAT